MELTIRDEFIKLGQALKLAGVTGSGVEAKIMIEEGKVLVNGAVETRRGKKLREGDTFSAGGKEFTVHTA
ncbi:MAG: RNA-binding S4 domain-containing protein [Lachnospiraceae bacterium]|nr:RNA-binding S4 domain-containing protein [Lachnospiraceae bacterium]